MITDAELRSLKPRDKLYKIRVDRGLYLHVHPNGSRLWRFRYIGRDKVDHTLSFGDYPRVTLADARRRAQAAQDDRREGNDPAIAKQARALTLEAVTIEWWQLQRPRWKPHHADDVLNRLRQDILTALGTRRLDDVTPPDVLRALRVVERRSIDMARRQRQRLDAIFAYAIAAGYATQNPAAQIVKAMAPLPRGGHQPAILDIDAARAMLRDIESQAAFPATKAANRFIALTAARPGEVREMRWPEIYGDVWTIPAERMKMQREHRIPLSPAALEIVEAMRPISGACPFVFVSATNSRKPLSDNAVGYLLNRNGYKGTHTAHGWRSLFSTYLNQHPPNILPPGVYIKDVVEACLAHLPDDDIRAAYQRGNFFDIRRQIMDFWAGVLLDGALPFAEVLTGPRR